MGGGRYCAKAKIANGRPDTYFWVFSECEESLFLGIIECKNFGQLGRAERVFIGIGRFSNAIKDSEVNAYATKARSSPFKLEAIDKLKFYVCCQRLLNTGWATSLFITKRSVSAAELWSR